MDHPPDWTLGVLAGGVSRRMGRDKVFLDIHGKTLLERVVERCAPRAAAVAFAVGSLPRPLPDALSAIPAVPDVHPGLGPLAGVHALLGAVETEWLAAVPCDMPFVDTFVLAAMVAETAAAGASVGHLEEDGRLHPFPLVARHDVALVLARDLAQGRARVVDPARDLAVRRIVPGGVQATAWTLCNLNSPDDYHAAVKYFASMS